MKTAALFAIGMAMAICTSATNTSHFDVAKCREIPGLKKEATTAQKIEADLINGTWTANSENGQDTYFFTNKGLVQILTTDRYGYQKFSASLWRVVEEDGHPFLVLSDYSHDENHAKNQADLRRHRFGQCC